MDKYDSMIDRQRN